MHRHSSKSNHRNVWICAYSILISNYNCGTTSYIIFLRNYDRQSSSTTVNIDLHDQVVYCLLFNTFSLPFHHIMNLIDTAFILYTGICQSQRRCGSFAGADSLWCVGRLRRSQEILPWQHGDRYFIHCVGLSC